MMDRDPNLSNVLRSWRHTVAGAPRFNAEVWTRIEAARDAPWTVAEFLARRSGLPAQEFRWAVPVVATLALVFAMAAGAGAGVLHTRLTENDRMAAAYVQTIDPLQLTGVHR